MSQTLLRSAKEQFDKQAKHYDHQWNQWTEESLVWLLSHVELTPTMRVLDVATGTGYTAFAFAPHVAEVVALDVSTGMLAEAQSRAQVQGIMNVVFREGAAESLPFPDETFDAVTCRIAPHHFLDVSQFLRETCRVLKIEGVLLLADTASPDKDPETDAWQNRVEALRDPSHVRNYSPQEWREQATQAGLSVEVLETLHGAIPLTLGAWLEKAGCEGERATHVREAFRTAPESAKHLYRITPLEGDDIAFAWSRVVLKARKFITL
jgi:ubiquinone/menaquinone biosynthesis C-methylase UbiE